MLRYARVAVLGMSVSACAQTDPYQNNYSWQPTGANAHNIAAQVANKNDLIRGRGARGSDGVESVTPLLKLYGDKPVPLPLTTTKGS